jgi:hydrogenase nickel incorporation protein HypA/HybF
VHELSIVDAIIEQVQKEVEQAGAQGRVARLDLTIGRLSGVCVDSIRFAFEMLAPGTILEGTEVRIREPRAVCACRACGTGTEIDDLAAACPQCGSLDVAIEGGRELLLETIEIE